MNSDLSALRLAWAFPALALLLFSSIATAEAGRVMYVSGEATLVRGNAIPITKGTAVEAGDLIRTGTDGRVQLLMADGDRIALRPSSEFRIDEFSGPSRTKPGEAIAGARPSSWRSFYTLAKGGFRTLTQSLGGRDPSSYQVRTPVATIGIRGTDYTILYCTDDCASYRVASSGVRVEGMQASVFRDSAGSRLLFAALGTGWAQDFVRAQAPEGGSNPADQKGQLFGGVSKGEINVVGPGGNKIVKDNEFFMVDDRRFEFLPEMPDGLQDKKTPSGATEYQEQVGEGEGEADGDAFSARTDPTEGEGTGAETADSGDASGDPELAESGEPPAQQITATDSSGNTVDLTSGAATDNFFPAAFGGSFGTGLGSVSQGSALLQEDDGASAETGLRWGRWSGGIARIAKPDGTTLDVDLRNESLHWITADSTDAPVLTISGTYQYQLIGNTDPTDNHGNVGFLADAEFRANFTDHTVQSSVAVGFDNGDEWAASGEGSWEPGGNGFSGTYDNIEYNNGGNCAGAGGCSGEFDGFFTGDSSSSAPPSGVGMTYQLDNGQGTSVSGAAAFGDPCSGSCPVD